MYNTYIVMLLSKDVHSQLEWNWNTRMVADQTFWMIKTRKGEFKRERREDNIMFESV